MKNFVCSNCGVQVRRPTAPLRCESCGQARIGLFRVADAPAGGSPPVPAAPRSEAPIAPPPPVGMMPPAAPAAPVMPVSPPAAPVHAAPLPAAPLRPATPPSAPVQPPPIPAAAVSPAAVPPIAPASVPPAMPSSPPSGDAGWKRPGRIPTRSTEEHEAPPRTISAPPEREPTPPPVSQRPDRQPPAAPPERAPPAVPPRRAEATPEKAATPAAKERAAAKPSGQAAQPGAVMWKFPLPSSGNPPKRQAIRSSPAVDAEGVLYAAVGPSLVAIAESAHGIEQQWLYDLDSICPGPVVLAADGRLRVHAGDGRLHCVSRTGQTSFEPVHVGEPLGWAAPIADTEGNTWISSYNGGLFKIGSQGTYQRNAYLATRQKFDSTGCINKGVMYIGCEDGFVYAIELNGSRGFNRWDPLADQGKTGWFINSSPTPGLDGQWIVAGRDEYFYAFQADGSLASKLHIRGQMLSSPVVGPQGHAYVGVSLERRGDQSRGKLVCVDLKSHRVRWEYEVNRPVESTPVVGDDGIIYFGDNSGTVHAVSPEGRRQWAHGVGSPVRSPGTIPIPHRVVFGLDNGHYVALMCSSKGISRGGWPKYMGDLYQTGLFGS